MKYLLLSFCILILASFQITTDREKLSAEQRKEIIDNTRHLTPSEITFSKIDINTGGKKYKESPELFAFFHGRDIEPHESELIMGSFVTANQSLVAVCYARLAECDQEKDSYFLYVIDPQGNVSEPLQIKYADNGFMVFEIDFKFIDESTIQISEKTSSQWAAEDGNKQDTLFTDKYTIAYLKTPLDTLDRKQSQKILKRTK